MRFSQKNYWPACHCQLVICTKVAQRDIRINKLEIPDYGPALGLNSFHSPYFLMLSFTAFVKQECGRDQL